MEFLEALKLVQRASELGRRNKTATVRIQSACRGFLQRRRVGWCPVCLSMTDQPERMATCRHIVCGACAAQCVRFGKTSCPTCRAPSRLKLPRTPSSPPLRVPSPVSPSSSEDSSTSSESDILDEWEDRVMRERGRSRRRAVTMPDARFIDVDALVDASFFNPRSGSAVLWHDAALMRHEPRRVRPERRTTVTRRASEPNPRAAAAAVAATNILHEADPTSGSASFRHRSHSIGDAMAKRLHRMFRRQDARPAADLDGLYDDLAVALDFLADEVWPAPSVRRTTRIRL